MTAIQKFIATIAGIAIVGAGVYYYTTGPTAAPGPSSTATTTTPGATTTPSSTSGEGALSVNTPNYKKPIAFSASIESNIRAELNEDKQEVIAQLDANIFTIGAWVRLGTLHKMGGDYKAAAEYWGFLAESFTGKAVPYYSLGDLYENFLKDTTKAEGYYKQSIAADPQNVNAYASLYTMYHYTLKDDVKARAILEQGLAANPGDNYLLGLKAELQ